MTTLSINPPALPFSGFRASVYAAVAAKVGSFVPVPAPVGRGSDVFKAAKKINLRLADVASPFEVRVEGTAKNPRGVGLFVAGTSATGRAPSDSASARRRTAFSADGKFGERIAPSLPLRVETAPARADARKAAVETVKAEVLALVLAGEEAAAERVGADALASGVLTPAEGASIERAAATARKGRKAR